MERMVEFDIGTPSFEEIAGLARMSIENMDTYTSTEYPELPWNTAVDEYNRRSNAPINEQEIKHLVPIELRSLNDGTPIVAIDVSILGLGETQCGTIYAIRGTVVSRKEERYRYSRLGPLPFHINIGENETIKERRATDHTILSIDTGRRNPTIICRRLLTVFETMLKRKVAKMYDNAVLLWDGALTIPSVEEEIRATNSLMEVARKRRNSIVGVSKKTCLFSLQGTRDPLQGYQKPCLIDIDSRIQRTQRFLLLGTVYVAKLASDGLLFRLDVDKELPEAERIAAVERMIGNDLTQDGYPETLRLAHIFSKFNATEVIGMHRFLDDNYGLRILEYPNIRRILFGPFAGNHSKEPDAIYAKPV
ncbi:MAG: hypothetical protein JSW01_00615 [Candidatus Bathyarchaeota archaeon]|nr:MAG: hypothetical protein JSW01_00615 [Candidatus Bathyarchaeota archaeon]